MLVVAGNSAGLLGGEFRPGAGWTTTTLTGSTTFAPGVSLAGSGAGLIVFRASGAGGELRWSRWSPGSWTAPVPIAAGVASQGAPSLTAIGNTWHLVFHGNDFKHYFGSFVTSWSPTAEQVGGAMNQSFGPSAASVTAAGADPVIAFAGNNQDLFDQTRAGAAWQAAFAHGLGSLVVLTPRIIPLSSGPELMIVFVRQSDNRIVFTTRSGGTWATPATINVNALTNEAVTLAALPNGGAALAYRGQNGEAYWSRYTPGAGWSAPAGVSSPNLVTPAPPVIVPGVGGADAELLALTSSGAIVHQRLTGTTWSAATPVGGTAFVAIGAASAP